MYRWAQMLMMGGRPVQAMLQSYGVATELVELQNLITVGSHVMEAALKRKESRGGHYNVDIPAPPAGDRPACQACTPPQEQRRAQAAEAPEAPGEGEGTWGSLSGDAPLLGAGPCRGTSSSALRVMTRSETRD